GCLTTTTDETGVAFAGLAGQSRMLADGRLTSAGLVDLLLRRVERLQPRLNAFRVVLTEQAREAAAAADAARADGDDRPLLVVRARRSQADARLGAARPRPGPLARPLACRVPDPVGRGDGDAARRRRRPDAGFPCRSRRLRSAAHRRVGQAVDADQGARRRAT